MLPNSHNLPMDAVRLSSQRRSNSAFDSPWSACGCIIGQSPLLLQALQRARAASGTDADVLIEAESGTGKEQLARFIHAVSSRGDGPFVAINCAAVPEQLIESELFGHAKGAFTGATSTKAGKFERANGGTLLLDEIGEMPLNLQPKLLRVLQEREFERVGETRPIRINIRIIATTNASLALQVEHGQFRSDLYYRLNVIPLSLPPLRERLEDLSLLVRHFAEKFAAEQECRLPHIDISFLDRLRSHKWPGNIRELSNFIHRIIALYHDGPIDAACFDKEFLLTAKPLTQAVAPTPGTRLCVIEKQHLESTLALANGNRTHAAEMLGISLRTVRNKIKEYGLPPRGLI